MWHNSWRWICVMLGTTVSKGVSARRIETFLLIDLFEPCETQFQFLLDIAIPFPNSKFHPGLCKDITSVNP